MGKKIAGVNALVKINTGTISSPVMTILGGQTDANLDRGLKDIEVTSKDGNDWEESIGSFKNWSIDFDAFELEDGDAAYTALEAAFEDAETILAELILPSGKKKSGTALVTSMPMKAGLNNAVTVSFKLKGTGALLSNDNTVTAPTLTNPTQAETGVAVDDTFTTSAFAVSAGTDTHGSTQWQISATADTAFATPVLDIYSSTEKVSLELPASKLSASTEYRLRVRHYGVKNGWSAWSTVHTFTTAA